MDLQPYKHIIRERCGLRFEKEKEATLAGGIRARMLQRGITNDAAYLACLLGEEDEFHSLVNLITINETYFFREPVHLDLLAERLVSPMLAGIKRGDAMRILCAGCSTGEEPYSVMIKLYEKYGAGIKGLISVIGVDIDTNALKRAEEGVYCGFSFRDFPAAMLGRYFEPLGSDRYRIRDFMRSGVRFMKLNLLGDGYPDALKDLDVVFYRNVSIYFDPETQRRIFEKLAGLLRDGGWLFVSATETLSHNYGVLPLVELDGAFCFQKNDALLSGRGSKTDFAAHAAPRPAAIKRSRPLAPPRPPSAAHTTEGTCNKTPCAVPSFDDALVFAGSKDYEKSLRCLETILARDPSFMKGRMLKAGILMNMKRYDEANQVCLQSLEMDRWNLEGHLLLGLIAKLQKDDQGAVKRFKEALYIQSSCWLGHFHLAEIYRLRGEAKNALREYEIASNLLKKGENHDHGLTFFPLAFSAEQIGHLCRHNLLKLKEGAA